MEDRSKLKSMLATALSDAKLLQKLPRGRVDELVDRYWSLPDYFRTAVESRAGIMGSPRRVDIVYFAMNLMQSPAAHRKVKSRWDADRRREERELKKLPAAMIDGVAHFKKSFLKEMRAAGADFVGDFLCDHGDKMPDDGDSTLQSAASDIASGYAYTNDWKPYGVLYECAADYVYEGMIDELKRLKKEV